MWQFRDEARESILVVNNWESFRSTSWCMDGLASARLSRDHPCEVEILFASKRLTYLHQWNSIQNPLQSLWWTPGSRARTTMRYTSAAATAQSPASRAPRSNACFSCSSFCFSSWFRSSDPRQSNPSYNWMYQLKNKNLFLRLMLNAHYQHKQQQ